MSYPSISIPRSFFFLITMVFLFIGCGDETASFPLDGVWRGEYSSVLTITDASIDFDSYGGEIVERNDTLRYIVFRYTNAPVWAPEQENRYNKLIWEKVRTDSPMVIRYSEGYAAEQATTNTAGAFIAWPDAGAVTGRTDIFTFGFTYATNY